MSRASIVTRWPWSRVSCAHYRPMSTASIVTRWPWNVRCVRGHLRSLKMVPFESFDMVSYQQFIVTMVVPLAVCEISSVKDWRDLENWLRGCSRSLKMAPFDRPYTTFYWSVQWGRTSALYCRMALRYFYVKILISVCTYLYATNSGYLPRLVRLTSFRTKF